MPADTAFDYLTPANRYGVTQRAPAITTSNPIPGIARSGGPGAGDNLKPFHPDHPMFWVGGLLLATFGLIFASTTVRIGPASGSISLGKS